MKPPEMSQTFTTPSAAPVASNVPVWSTAKTITGVVWGLRVRRSSNFREKEEDGEGLREYIRIDNDLEHMIRCEAEGVTAKQLAGVGT